MQFSELRHLKRFREIAGVLIKYGFDEIAQRLDLPGMDIIRKISPIEEVLELNERICRALEELGPTFVKIGQIMSLRPDLDVVQEIGDYVSRLAMQRYSPDVMWRNIRNSLSSIWASQREIPRQIQQIIGKLERGELGLHFQLDKLEQLVSSFENASNRLTTGIITGAIIMGSSMIITTGVGPYLFGFPALGVIGYLLSVVLGLWLVITILRTRKY